MRPLLRLGPPTTARVSPSDTVLQLKQRLADACGLPPLEQRLVLRGRVLRPDTARLKDLAGLADGAVLHLVRRPAQPHEGTAKPAPGELFAGVAQWLRGALPPADADRLMDGFRGEFSRFLDESNEDDLRRLAAA